MHALVLVAAAMCCGPQPYSLNVEEAAQLAQREGKPLLVYLGTPVEDLEDCVSVYVPIEMPMPQVVAKVPGPYGLEYAGAYFSGVVARHEAEEFAARRGWHRRSRVTREPPLFDLPELFRAYKRMPIGR